MSYEGTLDAQGTILFTTEPDASNSHPPTLFSWYPFYYYLPIYT